MRAWQGASMFNTRTLQLKLLNGIHFIIYSCAFPTDMSKCLQNVPLEYDFWLCLVWFMIFSWPAVHLLKTLSYYTRNWMEFINSTCINSTSIFSVIGIKLQISFRDILGNDEEIVRKSQPGFTSVKPLTDSSFFLLFFLRLSVLDVILYHHYSSPYSACLPSSPVLSFLSTPLTPASRATLTIHDAGVRQQILSYPFLCLMELRLASVDP